MSNLLQLACPKCSTRLQVRQPASATASARCGNCGHTFTFRVPQQPASSASSASRPAADGFLSGMPDVNTTIGGRPRTAARAAMPAPAPSFTRPARTASATRTPSRHAASEGNRWPALIAIVGSSLVLLVGVVGAAVWLLLGNSDLIPTSLSVFDSAGAILEDTDTQDLEIQRIVSEISSEGVTQERITRLIEADIELRLLVARAAKLKPMSEAEVIEWTGIESIRDEDTPPGRIFIPKKPVPVGPLDESAMEALREKVLEIPEEKRFSVTFVLSRALAKSEFIREYIRYGHLELSEPTLQGEQIAVRQIELLRQANALGASIVPKVHPRNVKEFESPEDISAYVTGKFEPIFDDLDELTEQMHGLAERRYRLPEDQVGDTKKYEDTYKYANQMLAQVYDSVIGLDHGKIRTFDSLSELLAANKEVQRAPFAAPSRVAAARPDPKAEAERARQEYERRRQAAADKRALEEKLESERKRAEAAEAKLAAAKRAERKAASKRAGDKTEAGEMPAEDSVASKAAPRGSAQDEGSSFDPGGGRFGPGGRFGRRGSPFGPGRPGGFGGPRGPVDGRGGPPGHSRRPGQPKPPSFDPSTGVTIRMKDAGSIKSSDVAGKFLKALNVGTRVSVRNGELTVQLSYTGSLDDVAKLIDFGVVVSKDDKSRTIIVQPM